MNINIIKYITSKYQLYSQKLCFITEYLFHHNKFTINISHFNNIRAKYQIIIHSIGDKKYRIIDTNHNSIAKGIVHETSMFEIGAISDSCQKLKIIIGNVKVRADKVNVNAVLISKKLVINQNNLSKYF